MVHIQDMPGTKTVHAKGKHDHSQSSRHSQTSFPSQYSVGTGMDSPHMDRGSDVPTLGDKLHRRLYHGLTLPRRTLSSEQPNARHANPHFPLVIPLTS